MKRTIKLMREAIRLLVKASPVTLARLMLSLIAMAATMVYMAVAALVISQVVQVVPWLGLSLVLLALVGLGWFHGLARRLLLSRARATQLAVMAKLVAGETPPDRLTYQAWGAQLVSERWGHYGALTEARDLISTSVCCFSNLVYTLASWLPTEMPRLPCCAIGRLVHQSVSSVDEAVLGRTFWRNRETEWVSARDGVVLYAMEWRRLLTRSLQLALVCSVPAALIVIAAPAPLGLWLALFSPVAGISGMVAAVMLGLTIKSSLCDSVSMVAMMIDYRQAIADLEPDGILRSRMGYVTGFQELNRLAAQKPEWVTSSPGRMVEAQEVVRA